MDKYLIDRFVIKVWLLTIILGPLLLFLFLGLKNSANLKDALETIPMFFITLIMGFVFSIPAFVLYTVVFKVLQNRTNNSFCFKLILAFVGILLIIISFIVMDAQFFRNFDLYSLSWPGSYCFVLLVFTFSLRLPGRRIRIEGQ